jgi:DNA-binding transcriptional LysR family regulator
LLLLKNVMDLNFRDIRAFIAVARAGSFTRAAERLHVSQPALTVQIRRLEATVGVRLLDRNSRNVALTPAGRELLPVLQKSLNDMTRVLDEARALGEGLSGTVRLACLPTFAASVLPDLIQAMKRSLPGVSFHIRDGVADMVERLVRQEDVDLGLTGGEASGAEFDVLYRGADRLVLVCPAAHPLMALAQVSVSDLLRVPLVLTAQGTSVRAVVDAAFAGTGEAPEVVCEPTYMMTAVAMVRGGLGVTILPESAREILAEPGLRCRMIDDPAFVRPIALIKKKGRSLSAAGEAFVDEVKRA